MKENQILKFKIRFILIVIVLCLLFLIAISLIRKSFASYITETDIAVTSKHAIYIFEEEEVNFELDTSEIVPSDDTYIYEFSIKNYNNERRSDVDLSYRIKFIATTNLPLEYELYKDNLDTTNLINTGNLIQDEDMTWYKNMEVDEDYNMFHSIDKEDKYYLVIKFPKLYSSFPSYGGVIENIELNVKSKQIIE